MRIYDFNYDPEYVLQYACNWFMVRSRMNERWQEEAKIDYDSIILHEDCCSQVVKVKFDIVFVSGRTIKMDIQICKQKLNNQLKNDQQ